jgi:hypothetical protein
VSLGESDQSERLRRTLDKRPTEAGFSLEQASAFGGAGVCLAILLSIAQLPGKTLALHVSAIAASVGLPFFIAYASAASYYLHLGKKSYSHHSGLQAKVLIRLMASFASLALVVSVGGLVWSISRIAAYAFGGAAFVAFILFGLFHDSMAAWLHAKTSPDDRADA